MEEHKGFKSPFQDDISKAGYNIIGELSPKQQHALESLFCDLSDWVAVGSEILALAHNREDNQLPDLTILGLLRHIVEKLAATSHVLSLGLLDSACVLLRSVYEGCLSLEYILAADTDKRALAYQVVGIYDDLKPLVNLKSGESNFIGSMNKAAVLKDFTANAMELYGEQIEAEIKSYEDSLKAPEYQDIVSEYNRVKGLNSYMAKNLKWYSLFSPDRAVPLASLTKLSSHLVNGDTYVVLYNHLSKFSHATNAYKAFEFDSKVWNLKKVKQIGGVEQLVSYFLWFAARSYSVSLNHYEPDKLIDFQDWLGDETFAQDLINRFTAKLL